MNAHEALPQVKNMVDATVAEIAPNDELSPDAEEGGLATRAVSVPTVHAMLRAFVGGSTPCVDPPPS